MSARLAMLLALLALPIAAHAQNRVSNADFDVDTSGWIPGGVVITIGWSPLDPGDPNPSGSLQVVSTLANGATGGALHCVSVADLPVVDLQAMALVPDQVTLDFVLANIFVYYYGLEGCTTTELGFEFAAAFVAEGQGWQPIAHRYIPPSGTQSMLLVLGVTKDPTAVPGVAHFDQVHLPEPRVGSAGIVALFGVGLLARSRRGSAGEDLS